jgi:hypothetical protein
LLWERGRNEMAPEEHESYRVRREERNTIRDCDV